MSELDLPNPSVPGVGQRRVERISQAALQVRSRDDFAAFTEIRSLLLKWLSEKAGSKLPDEILQGRTGDFSAIGSQRVETAALEEPLYWTFRQDDMDKILPRRTWVTEAAVGLSPSGDLTVGHRLHCVTLGDAAPFSRSVPKFMREIARKYNVYLDGFEVGLEARRAENIDDARTLLKIIRDIHRKHPVIGISEDKEHLKLRSCIIDPDKVATSVFGAAHVWVITPEASEELTAALGRELSVFHGGVRSWRFPFSLDDSGYSHPLTVGRRALSPDGAVASRFQRELIDWALRFSAGRSDSEKLLPAFGEVRRFVARITQEKAASEGRSERELLKLALEENHRLVCEISDQRAEHAEILTLADDEVRRVQFERDEALREANRLRMRLAAIEDSLRRQRGEVATSIPETLMELQDWAHRELRSHVEVLPRAINMAKKSVFEDVQFVYKVLILLRDQYVPMKRGGGGDIRVQWENSLREFGLELTPSLSGGGAGQFGDEYRVQWNGRKRELDLHLKGSNSRDPRYGFRCYFFWDEENRIAVVGAIPEHLRNNIS